ncbi:hypothetical protein QBC35DRAFT_179794 [Podospora australis]|uniref:Major facilitator superfamily (MFS) profile domain-containing protein n=1 Tax=Podospora australis TaxID=1536484 RepID=A0AAN6WVH3_9PEZI|nr:hypothetical protein QBC35DRAFT_179794 [Podospora australis]
MNPVPVSTPVSPTDERKTPGLAATLRPDPLGSRRQSFSSEPDPTRPAFDDDGLEGESSIWHDDSPAVNLVLSGRKGSAVSSAALLAASRNQSVTTTDSSSSSSTTGPSTVRGSTASTASAASTDLSATIVTSSPPSSVKDFAMSNNDKSGSSRSSVVEAPTKTKAKDSRRVKTFLIFMVAASTGILFGFDSGVINGIMAVAYFENIALAHVYQDKLEIGAHVRYANGTDILRPDPDTGNTDPTVILGPITISQLYDRLKPFTSAELKAAFGYNLSAPPNWLLLKRNVRPFWICEKEGIHLHAMSSDTSLHDKHVPAGVDEVDYIHVNSTHVNDEEVLPPQPNWFGVPASQKMMLVASMTWGTLLGCFVGSDLADWVGRRPSILLGNCIFFLGVLFQGMANNTSTLAWGRFVLGLSMGIITTVVIVYLSEISSSTKRRWTLIFYQFAIAMGLLLASVVTLLTRKIWRARSFKIPIFTQLVWNTLIVFVLFCFPESPRWLIKVDQAPQALNSIARLRGKSCDDEEVKLEMDQLITDLNFSHNGGPMPTKFDSYWDSWKLCFLGSADDRTGYLRRVLLGMTIMMFQQITGINFIFYFGITFLEQHGYRNVPVVLAVFSAINVVFTAISFLCVNTFKRRDLLVYGGLGMAVFQFAIGVTGVIWNPSGNKGLVEHTDLHSFGTYILIACYIICYSVSWGPVPWSLIGEIFPLEIRARAVGFSTASNWLFNSLMCVFSPYLMDCIGMGIFMVWGSFSVAAVIFVLLFVPETRGKTLEQISCFFHAGIRKSWLFMKWDPDSEYIYDINMAEQQKRDSYMSQLAEKKRANSILQYQEDRRTCRQNSKSSSIGGSTIVEMEVMAQDKNSKVAMSGNEEGVQERTSVPVAERVNLEDANPFADSHAIVDDTAASDDSAPCESPVSPMTTGKPPKSQLF